MMGIRLVSGNSLEHPWAARKKRIKARFMKKELESSQLLSSSGLEVPSFPWAIRGSSWGHQHNPVELSPFTCCLYFSRPCLSLLQVGSDQFPQNPATKALASTNSLSLTSNLIAVCSDTGHCRCFQLLLIEIPAQFFHSGSQSGAISDYKFNKKAKRGF